MEVRGLGYGVCPYSGTLRYINILYYKYYIFVYSFGSVKSLMQQVLGIQRTILYVTCKVLVVSINVKSIWRFSSYFVVVD